MQILTVLVDLLKGLGWPLVVALIAYWYRSEVNLLLPRLRKAGPTGVEFEPADQQQKAVANTESTPPGELKDLPGLSRTAAIKRVELELHQSLETVDERNRIDVLVRYLAQARLEAHFERTYNAIFGSQIQALEELNVHRRVTFEDAEGFYSVYKERYFEMYTNFPFLRWYSFLVSQSFVEIKGNIFEITDIGEDFLFYLTSRHLSKNKPF